MKRIAFLAGAAITAAAYAVPTIGTFTAVSPSSEVGEYVINLDGSIVDFNPSPRTVTENYDNFRSATSTPPGVSNLLRLYTNGANEVADDLAMTVPGLGVLDTMGLSVANTAAAGGPTLVTGAGTVRFYGLTTGQFLAGFNFTLPAALNGAPGASFRLSFAAGALAPLNIHIPDGGVFASTQWTASTWSDAQPHMDLMGLQIRGPINTGSSTDNLFNANGATIGTSFNFDGQTPDPDANNAYFIRTNDVPEPASLALLALGGLALIRRR